MTFRTAAEDGSLYTMGLNTDGQLGHSTASESVQVSCRLALAQNIPPINQ